MKKIKIVFVIDKIGFLELSSIPILSSLVKKQGHYVKVIEFSRNPQKACNEIISWNPNILAYSICSNETKRYLEINKILKKSKDSFFSLFGGPHPTFAPSFIKEEGVDAICRGEADICFPVFLQNFDTDKMYETSNFSFKKAAGEIKDNPLTFLVSDLDTLPFPDRDIVYSQSRFLASSPIKSFFAGRGCPFNCSYCFNHAFNAMYKGKGKILRTKSVTYLFNEIQTVRNKHPLNFIKLHDDIFGADRDWLMEFANRYPREIRLPFLCHAHPNMITDEYCRQLKKAGCYSVCVAIECGNEQIRDSILNRKINNKQIISSCENLRKYGIRIYTLNMIGLPGESDSEIFQTIELNQQCRVDFADASIFQPYPGTRIAEYCKTYGYLSNWDEVFKGQYLTTVLNFKSDFKEKIYILHKLFPIIVDYPKLKLLLKFTFKLKKFLSKKAINLVYKLYYGLILHRRIYASKIPLIIRLRGAFLLLISKHRV